MPDADQRPVRYDFGDTAQMTPLLKMFTLGHTFMPSPIHAGGLRYHGMAPLVSLLTKEGVIEATSCHQNAAFEAAVTFARAEGVLPAPETAHAVKAAIDEAMRCKQEGKEECIVFNFSGHGHFDLSSYEKYFNGELEDYEYPEHAIEEALQHLPDVE